MEEINKYMDEDLKLWNKLAEINFTSKFYDVQSFKKGKLSLNPTEIEEVGDVSGKSLLHLQCHFGMDSLSWAKLGAKVTGVDYSEKAIEMARSLSNELGIEANFIHSNIYSLPNVLSGNFDIIFTSYGVLCWLPDLKKWAEIISLYLKPDGIFYIIEEHPFLTVFEDENGDLDIKYSYFYNPKPMKFQGQVYVDRSISLPEPSYEWTHSLSDIINALISAGLEIQYLHEFPFAYYDHFRSMVKYPDGKWRLKGKENFPLMFSIKCTK